MTSAGCNPELQSGNQTDTALFITKPLLVAHDIVRGVGKRIDIWNSLLVQFGNLLFDFSTRHIRCIADKFHPVVLLETALDGACLRTNRNDVSICDGNEYTNDDSRKAVIGKNGADHGRSAEDVQDGACRRNPTVIHTAEHAVFPIVMEVEGDITFLSVVQVCFHRFLSVVVPFDVVVPAHGFQQSWHFPRLVFNYVWNLNYNHRGMCRQNRRS